jgi:hypothetical protein
MRITQRINILKHIILIGLLCSVLISFNLWAGERFFPKMPLINGFQGFYGYFDYINISVLILLIFIGLIDNRRYPIVLLIIWCIYLCFDDQNRLQPWFVNYILLLFVWLFYKKRVDEPNNFHAVFISMQFIIAGIYIFSGLQKFNANFFTDTYPWFISPLNDILSERQMNLILKFGNVFPYIEVFLGISVLIKPLRFISLPLIIFMHVLIIILLGPLGLNQNYVVWPWNITMILINLILFAYVKRERFYDFTMLLKTAHFYIVLITMFILPIFSFNNQYDSYLSSSLYSGNTHQIDITLTETEIEKLPLYVKHFTYFTDTDYKLNLKLWAITELGSPCIPEERVFQFVINKLIDNYSLNQQNIKIEILERQKLFGFN